MYCAERVKLLKGSILQKLLLPVVRLQGPRATFMLLFVKFETVISFGLILPGLIVNILILWFFNLVLLPNTLILYVLRMDDFSHLFKECKARRQTALLRHVRKIAKSNS
jgi:hypothetical protein